MSSVERKIHNEIMTLLQRVADEEGIRITQICSTWMDVDTVSEAKSLVTSVHLSTAYKKGAK